jgi:NADH:ubiquinone oxidoreductase subunit 6 (subunit J)
MMKILFAVRSATFRSLKSWKGVLIIWFLSLLMVSLLALPLRASLNSALGSSTITERLIDGIDVEVFSDMGEALTSLISYLSSGFFLLLVVGFLLNAFLSGGLFNSLKGSSGKFSTGEFFRASAKYFWSFLVILSVISLIVVVLALLVVGVPMSLAGNAEVQQEGALLKTFILFSSAFILLLIFLLLVADYARAWQVAEERNACFKAIGFGFRQTFRTFRSSYLLMLILLVIQVSYGWLVLNILPGMKPVSGGGVFFLFLISQSMFIIKILLKMWRYGSVTSLMEMTNKEVP